MVFAFSALVLDFWHSYYSYLIAMIYTYIVVAKFFVVIDNAEGSH